ncbi:HD domain-containing phosphohydrolase [Paenibacillus sp. PK4536]|uniref:Cyclic di-GMP phosphodiesterase response regulator RpfG n=1 Tax=Paenibacillus nuruki TaxID=1886670 RepID=A0A1E3L8P1_9BACL|nr:MULTISPECIES: HD domain-containing phosphohydrolase [Paenibacillus]ODP30106.1 Cyclic di-GMP phosphodiesterase response regulator RpfG [Paenibacillus nuruki]WIM38598.1 HD domain-containing phosphohydrolase [Paenibacillus sp. PK4536]
MKEKNGYTILLSLVGVASIVYMIREWHSIALFAIAPILFLIVLLDLFPVRLLSGEEYSGSLVGFLILALAFGYNPAILGIVISTIISYTRKKNFDIRQMNLFRICSALGKSVISIYLSYQVMEALNPFSTYIQAGLGALVFSLVYMLLLAGASTTIIGTPFLNDMVLKLKELIVPVLLCTIIVPHFLRHISLGNIVYETVYVLLFLLLIIFLSHGFIRQLQIRMKSSEEFIRLSELRISQRNEGHGKNTGILCQYMLELLAYPKKRRTDLVNYTTLHDIGKSLLPMEILTKRGALSLTEEKEYQSHATESSNIIYAISGDKKAAAWVLHHHERYDGKGFPSGLKGQDIPYESRIIALCNHLEHLLSSHSDNVDVLHQLQRLSGKVLDPKLIQRITLEIIIALRQLVITKPLLEGSDLIDSELPSVDEHKEMSGFTGGTVLLKYKDHHSLQEMEDIHLKNQLGPLAEHALRVSENFYEVIQSNQKTFEAHFYPENNWVAIVLTDITPALEYREQLHQSTMRSYKDVIETLSKSKIDICLEQQEIEEHLGSPLANMDIMTKSDVSSGRSLVMEYIPEELKINQPKKLMHIKLAVSEGVTNLIKHAAHGKLSVYSKPNVLQIYITDHGSGIPIHELPKMILISGYSSKRSLGKGFALMYTSADRIMVHTSSKGTSILLEFDVLLEEAG